MVTLSLVVPTLERRDPLFNLLRHLEHQARPADEIVVVDQSQEDDVRLRDLARRRSDVRYHRIPVRGLPNARNVGVSLCRGDVVLFLDDDTVPDPGLVQAHAERYEDPTVAGVGGRVSGGYDGASGPVGRFDPGKGTVVRNFGATEACDVDHLPGGNMSFRREVFRAVGGFDVAFGGSAIGEETDFCLRARRAGFRLVFEPRAAVDHLHWPTGGCRAPRFEDWLAWHAHNGMLFALR
ncbi:MAG TPA: glycosyltransferase, partial [Planctomycetota bacterium]|nr:glycosyltransferase [Planctomycetota bacterium]